MLVYLGYLSWCESDRTVSIPNREVSMEYVNAISTMNWGEVIRSEEESRKLLQSLWDMDVETVAQGNLLLVGINYDKDKKHTCIIEKISKNV